MRRDTLAEQIAEDEREDRIAEMHAANSREDAHDDERYERELERRAGE